MTATAIGVTEVQALLQQGYRLIDIRSADEFRREHIAGAENIPMDVLPQHNLAHEKVVFHCLSGMRTQANGAALSQSVAEPALILAGGLQAWKQAQGAVVIDATQPLPLMRQVQIVAGLLVFLSVVLGVLVSSKFLFVAAFVGAGLTFAGITGWCGMALLLMKMPWNKQSQHRGNNCSL